MIKTIDGRIIDTLIGVRYVEAFRTPDGSKVATNEIRYSRATGAEVTYPGPMFEAGEFRKVEQAQRLIDAWLEADREATGLYKQTRYWIVNRLESERKIDAAIGRMNKWELKRSGAQVALAGLGVREY